MVMGGDINQRATPSIEAPYTEPRIGELVLRHNMTPSQKTWDAVRNWFKSAKDAQLSLAYWIKCNWRAIADDHIQGSLPVLP